MKKQTIKLTENELKKLIKESVNSVLKEATNSQLKKKYINIIYNTI